MIRPTPEFDDAGGAHHEDRPSTSQEMLLREMAGEIVRLSPGLAAILCRAGAEKVASMQAGDSLIEG